MQFDTAYMCLTDFECHEGDMRGVRIYGDLDDLKKDAGCIEGCGWVKVQLTQRLRKAR